MRLVVGGVRADQVGPAAFQLRPGAFVSSSLGMERCSRCHAPLRPEALGPLVRLRGLLVLCRGVKMTFGRSGHAPKYPATTAG